MKNRGKLKGICKIKFDRIKMWLADDIKINWNMIVENYATLELDVEKFPTN